MMAGRAGALAAASMLLSGCVAAVAAIPIAAAGNIGRQQMTKRHRPRPAPQPVLAAAPAAPAKPAAPTLDSPAPAAMQYLYGSGEAAALSIQAYQALYGYLRTQASNRQAKREVSSVVLAPDATLAAPHFEPCDNKPLAAVFDVDETVLLNLGYEADDALRGGGEDGARWQRWEANTTQQVVAVPGAAETLSAARRDGIAILFNTNRSSSSAPATIAALNNAGLGPAELGKTLWLRPDGAGNGKDARRWEISQKYCVIALVGDQLGDFSDLFNAAGSTPALRRNAASQTMIAPLWGAGWFVLPNPVYGTAIKGKIGEIFPPDQRWTDPMEAK